jgi:HlyD family secretion protein
MANAKVVSLKARASQMSHLCFPTSGIVEALGLRIAKKQHKTFPIQLGDQVTPFPFVDFYKGLSTLSPTVPTGSRLMYDSEGILNDPIVQASLLMTLRAESVAAVLDKAINARQNSFLAKYSNQAEIIAAMQSFYNPTSPLPNPSTSKPDALNSLYGTAISQMIALMGAYTDGLGASQAFPNDVPPQPTVVPGPSGFSTTKGGPNFGDSQQTIANTAYPWRTPLLDAQAQGLRAQISLLDQQMSQFMAGQNLPFLENVFNNNKQSMDLDVKQLQIAYLNTILMSPIGGVITGIYKNSGDWVQAGEPVIRIEDNTSVILAGTVAYQGLISIGSLLTVTTSLFGTLPAAPLPPAIVIAVRGRPNEDDLWDVHAICDNSTAPVLPLNYSFDCDDVVTIAP